MGGMGLLNEAVTSRPKKCMLTTHTHTILYMISGVHRSRLNSLDKRSISSRGHQASNLSTLSNRNWNLPVSFLADIRERGGKYTAFHNVLDKRMQKQKYFLESNSSMLFLRVKLPYDLLLFLYFCLGSHFASCI